MFTYLISHLFLVQIQIYPQFAAYKLQKNYMHPLPKEYYKEIYIHTLRQATLGLHYFSMLLAHQTISIKGIKIEGLTLATPQTENLSVTV